MSTPLSSHPWSNSDTYEAFMGRWSRVAADAALAWLDPPTSLRWLDVGCGTGALTEAILANAAPAEVLGIDPSVGFIARAGKLIRDERVTFTNGNAEDLPAPNDHYDVVIAGLVLHFMSDRHQGVLEMTRCARPGGTVTSYIWDMSSEELFLTPFWRAATSLDLDATASLYRQELNSLERVTELFTSSPLEQVTAASLDFPVRFRDFADYWEPCLLNGSSPVQRYTQTLSDEGKAELRERLRDYLPVAADGSIPLQGRLLITRGMKPE